ncbi:MAG: hypothetical protein LBR11_09680 [Deltaproteobacteria bacterium]|jgi:hypothetical protein|nr:hypothetical protein [Deltaproteobacteria bacterium]
MRAKDKKDGVVLIAEDDKPRLEPLDHEVRAQKIRESPREFSGAPQSVKLNSG